jgi:hypothetical protein
MSNIKICRIGHRNPRNGVITIASDIIPKENKIFWGASYCSPREPKYIKEIGNDLALAKMEFNKEYDFFASLYDEFSHSNIIKTILRDMFISDNYPKWAELLILEQLRYPTGLLRYPSDMTKNGEAFDINQIIVSDQKSKDQILLALSYMLQNMNIDFNFIAPNAFLNIIFNPDKIIVK